MISGFILVMTAYVILISWSFLCTGKVSKKKCHSEIRFRNIIIFKLANKTKDIAMPTIVIHQTQVIRGRPFDILGGGGYL